MPSYTRLPFCHFLIQELEKQLADLEAQQSVVLYLVHLSSYAEHLNDQLIYIYLNLTFVPNRSCIMCF